MGATGEKQGEGKQHQQAASALLTTTEGSVQQSWPRLLLHCHLLLRSCLLDMCLEDKGLQESTDGLPTVGHTFPSRSTAGSHRLQGQATNVKL